MTNGIYQDTLLTVKYLYIGMSSFCVFQNYDIVSLFLDGSCTFPSYMTGTWYDNKFIEVEFLSSSVMYLNQYSITRSGTATNLTCYLQSGDKYILR